MALAHGVGGLRGRRSSPGELLLSFLRPPGTPWAALTFPRGTGGFTRRILEPSGERTGHLDAARWLLNLLLLAAARLAGPQLGVSADAHLLLERAFRVIEARFHEPISLRDVARAVGRSPAHRTHLARLETGRTVLEWIGERRLLMETDLSLERVAELSGFADAS